MDRDTPYRGTPCPLTDEDWKLLYSANETLWRMHCFDWESTYPETKDAWIMLCETPMVSREGK